jgi:ribonuclease P protein subunit RPR2
MSIRSRGRFYGGIARSRTEKLFELAEREALAGNFERADRYIFIARKIAMKCQYPLPSKFRKRMCRHCYSYILPGITGRIRLNREKICIFCYRCGGYMRFPYIREHKSRKLKKE